MLRALKFVTHQLGSNLLGWNHRYLIEGDIIRSIHGVFLQNRLYLGHTGVKSFRMQFKKVGRGLLRESKRREGEWAVLAKAKGDNFFICIRDEGTLRWRQKTKVSARNLFIEDT